MKEAMESAPAALPLRKLKVLSVRTLSRTVRYVGETEKVGSLVNHFTALS